MTDLHLLPGDALPNLLAVGSVVSIDWHADDDPPRTVTGVVVQLLPAEHGDPRILWYCDDPAIGLDNRAAMFLRLDLTRPEAIDHVSRVLARVGHPVWHLLDAERTGALSRRHIAEAVGWSVRAGRALPAVYGPWTRWGSAGLPEGLVQYDRRPLAGTGPVVSYFDGRPRSGGRAEWMLTRPEADVVVLRHGGRIDGETLTLPEIA